MTDSAEISIASSLYQLQKKLIALTVPTLLTALLSFLWNGLKEQQPAQWYWKGHMDLSSQRRVTRSFSAVIKSHTVKQYEFGLLIWDYSCFGRCGEKGGKARNLMALAYVRHALPLAISDQMQTPDLVHTKENSRGWNLQCFCRYRSRYSCPLVWLCLQNYFLDSFWES